MHGLYTVTWPGGERRELDWRDVKALIDRLGVRGIFGWTIRADVGKRRKPVQRPRPSDRLS